MFQQEARNVASIEPATAACSPILYFIRVLCLRVELNEICCFMKMKFFFRCWDWQRNRRRSFQLTFVGGRRKSQGKLWKSEYRLGTNWDHGFKATVVHTLGELCFSLAKGTLHDGEMVMKVKHNEVEGEELWKSLTQNFGPHE